MLKIKPIYVPREDWIHLRVVVLVVVSLSEAGLRASICKAPLSQEASGVETACFLPQSFCLRNPGTLQGWRGESHPHHISQPVCVSRIHLMPREEAE